MSTDFAEHFVPRPADLRIEIPSKRTKMFIEKLLAIHPRLLDAFASRRIAPVACQSTLVPFRPRPRPAFMARSLDNHFRHILAHANPDQIRSRAGVDKLDRSKVRQNPNRFQMELRLKEIEAGGARIS